MAQIRVSIVFASGARIGAGKAALLESIGDTGSISAAARDLGMSYKRAWLLLDSINQAFTEPVVTAAPGGAGGGGATLTPFGAEVLERYRRIYERAAAEAADDVAALARRARPEAGPDYLVLATGSQYTYFGHSEWPRLAPGLKSDDDATLIRRRLLLAFEAAETVADPTIRRRLLTFVLVGAGPTGVEMAGTMGDLAHATLSRDFRYINPHTERLLLGQA